MRRVVEYAWASEVVSWAIVVRNGSVVRWAKAISRLG